MSARKGYLLPSPKYTTIMSCSDSPSGNAFLVDSLISGRGESGGGHYAGSAVCVPHSASTEVPYGLHNYGYFPGMGKRNDVGAHNMVSASGAYMSNMEMWIDAQRSCRMDQEQPVGPQVAPCSFPQNIKEESTYCLYEQPKCPKAATAEDLTYSRLSSAGLGSTSCTVTDSGGVGGGGGGGGGSVPVPGYFRLSQTHAHSHKLYNTNGPQPNPSHSHFGLHPAISARFHTPSPTTSVPATVQKERITRLQEDEDEEEEAEGETVSSAKAAVHSHTAAGAEETRESSDAEASSNDEAEENDKQRPAKTTKGNLSCSERCGRVCLLAGRAGTDSLELHLSVFITLYAAATSQGRSENLHPCSPAFPLFTDVVLAGTNQCNICDHV